MKLDESAIRNCNKI